MTTPVFRFEEVAAIAERKDVTPEEGKSKYGDVTYADEKNKKYPIDTEAHVRAAWSYINMPKNAGKYSSEDAATIKGKIRAAGKKFGIDFSDGDDKKTEATAATLVVFASYSVNLNGETPNKIVYMPKGKWKLQPRVNGVPGEIEVDVDPSAATILQTSLTKRLTDTVRPFGAFDHKPGPASFIPKQFEWDENQGVILEVDWTKSGIEAVKGKDYSYFSPTFLLNETKVAGLPEQGEIGSLTNNPAFRRIQRIAASADKVDACSAECPQCGNSWTDDDLKPGDNVVCPECDRKFTIAQSEGNLAGVSLEKVPGSPVTASKTTRKITMEINPVLNKLVELQVITAAQANADNANETFVIRVIGGMHEALVMANKANDMLKTENLSLQSKVQIVQAAEADKTIEAAIKEGKIPPKDQDTINFFKKELINNPDTTKKVLASLPGNPILANGGKPWISVSATDNNRAAAAQGHTANDIIAMQSKMVKAIQAANPNLDFNTAFNLAREQNPTLFVEA